jgi:hypothetical protein
MNRKKALILIMALELILLGILAMVFMYGMINLTAFIVTFVVISFVSSVLTIIAVRKLPET